QQQRHHIHASRPLPSVPLPTRACTVARLPWPLAVLAVRTRPCAAVFRLRSLMACARPRSFVVERT
ncbi:hypothetical protein, partial [Streptomyces sp. T21Q-yed]|uniref:hypothetical protein n=1 Tax=Streptomyces sp. T21Q-yed TaxID=3018441 RepID=UPI0023DF2454